MLGIVGGSLWLRGTNYRSVAALPLLLLLVPLIVCVGGSVLFSVFYMLLMVFGKGRMN